MPDFDSDGVRIAYDDVGSGPPIVLVHGFAANVEFNWARPGWIDALTGAGRRVVALDCRGHGRSDKPLDPAAYGGDLMPSDVLRLMDHLEIERADLMGYSMGGAISMALITTHPERFRSAVLGGVGGGRPNRDRKAIAQALSANVGPGGADAVSRAFRAFATSTGADLKALAAVMRSERPAVSPEALSRVRIPVMIVIGEQDDLVGDARPLADAIPAARLVTLPGRDHLTAVGDPLYKRAVLEFLSDSSGSE
ncbi:MAG: alpha/beta fold hydrolase [Myxococcota bacterium]